jgi:tRNA(fMet)-specific endonuclease VapC
MIVLDSDYLSLLEWPEGASARKILEALKPFASDEVATTIVNFEEQMQGWVSAINRQKELKDQIERYRRMRRSLRSYCSIQVIEFDEFAATQYQRMRKQYSRLGTKDLKIAAITLARRATLWTRNMQHFGQITGLDAVDITKE